MSRHEARFSIAEEAELSAADLRSLADQKGTDAAKHALARFLSRSEGWEQARDQLAGAFAPTGPAKEG